MLAATIGHDLETGVATAAFQGLLDLSTAPDARLAVQKCLAEHPQAVIVDLEEVEVPSPVSLTVIPAAARLHQLSWDVMLLVVASAASATGRSARRGLTPFLQVYEDRAAAMDAVLGGPPVPCHRRVHLPASPGSPAAARALVSEACGTWQLKNLIDDAELIMSELVSNAVEHAGTDLEVTVVLSRHFLHLQVRDRAATLPAPPPGSPSRSAPSGRGLWLVGQLAASWGTNVHPNGKLVWATLHITELRPPASRTSGLSA